MKINILVFVSILFFSCQNEGDKSKIKELERKIENNSVLIDSLNKKRTASVNDKSKNKMNKNKAETRYEYMTYCNARFSFCIDYPSNFIPQGESDNGDGQKFLSKNRKAIIYSFGGHVLDEISTLETNYNISLEEGIITYKMKKNSYFIVSGIKGKDVFYKKTLQRKIDNRIEGNDTDVLITYIIEYPIKEKELYDTYCHKINNMLK